MDKKTSVILIYRAREFPLYIRNISLFKGVVLILAIGLLSVYLFPSGGPQLADGPLMLLVAAHILERDRNKPVLRGNVTNFIAFVVWATFVNIIYFLWQPSDYLPLLKSAELIYTFLIFLTFSYLFRDLLEARNIWFLYMGVFLSILFIFTVKGYSEEGIRSVLSFNNPNQLGYYSLFLAAVAALLITFKDKFLAGKRLYYWADVLILFFAHILCLLSLSRGALLSLGVLDLWIFPRLTRRILLLLVPALLLATLVVVWRPAVLEERLQGRPGREITAETAQEEMEKRLLHQFSIMKGMDYLVGRGGRSLTPQEKARGIHEVHNIFGEIFRNYGLIGLGLFCYWLFIMVWRSRVVSAGWYVWGALLIYNMTHYGLRFRSFWILLAFLNAMIWLEKKRQENAIPEQVKPGISWRPAARQAHPIS